MRLQFKRICYGRSGMLASILERLARVVLLALPDVRIFLFVF
jgi:hypothetical protein